MRRAHLLMAWVALLLCTSACGVTVQDKPTVVADAALPPEPPDETDSSTPDQLTVGAYLVASNRLVRVERRAATNTLEQAIDELMRGPTEDEVAAGTRTAIAPSARRRAASVSDGVASIDLTRAFLDVTGEEQILAIAQVVFTATDLKNIVAVQLLVDGEAIEVPRADGALSPTPVARADYVTIGPIS